MSNSHQDRLNWNLSTCRSCGAPVVWGKVAKSGKKLLINLNPVPDKGNIVIEAWEGATTPILRVMNKAELEILRESEVQGLWVAHFTACPQANQWRRKK